MLASLYTSSGNHRSARIGTALPDVCSSAGSVDSWWEWVPSKANVADLPVRDPSTWDGEARGVVWPRYTRASTRKASDGVSCDFLLRLSSATPQRCCAESACWPQGSRPDHLSNCDLTTSAQAPSSAACHPRSPFLPLRLCGGGPIPEACGKHLATQVVRAPTSREEVRPEVVAACGATEPLSLTAHCLLFLCSASNARVCGPTKLMP